MYIEPLQVLTYFGGYPEPQNIPLIKQKHPLTSLPTTTISVKVICNPMYKIMCVFTYTCSQKHNNLSDSITM